VKRLAVRARIQREMTKLPRRKRAQVGSRRRLNPLRPQFSR
jgi:hypothetical protein